MCNSIFIGCFCVAVFHCNTYELYRPFSIQIVIHIELYYEFIRVLGRNRILNSAQHFI